MTAPHTRQPEVLPRPACTPTAIRAVLAANADSDILQRSDAMSMMTSRCRCAHCISAQTARAWSRSWCTRHDLVLVVRIQWLGG